MTGDRHWIVSADDDGQRLDKYLASEARAGSRGRARDALARGRVFVNDVEMAAEHAARPVRPGDKIRLWIDRPGSARPPVPPARDGLVLVHEDADLVVVDKPAGLLTVPLDRGHAPSVLDLLQQRFRSHRTREPLPVHRIDKDTSGLVVFALHERARARLASQFAARTPERIYLALVAGHPSPASGTWNDRLSWDDDAFVQRRAKDDDPEARDAACEYRTVRTFRDTALLEVRLHTGRQGQIRAQAQLHGHALIGDRRYRPREGSPGHGVRFPRQALHAQRLTIDHPDGRRLAFAAPLPPDFHDLIDTLRRQSR